MSLPRYSRWDVLYFASLSRAERVALPRRSGLGRRPWRVFRPAIRLFRWNQNLVFEFASICMVALAVVLLVALAGLAATTARHALAAYVGAFGAAYTLWSLVRTRDPAWVWLARSRTRITRSPELPVVVAGILRVRRIVIVDMAANVPVGSVSRNVRRRLQTPVWLSALMALGLGGAFAFPLLAADAHRVGVGIAGLVFFLGALSVDRAWRRRFVEGLAQAGLMKACPDCGHDLAWAAGLNGGLGPERCVECGSPWPFVPPPLTQGTVLAPGQACTEERADAW